MKKMQTISTSPSVKTDGNYLPPRQALPATPPKNWRGISHPFLLLFSFSPFSFLLFSLLLSPFSASAQQYTVYKCDFNKWTDGMPDGWHKPQINPTCPSIVSPYTPAYSGNYSCKFEGCRQVNMIIPNRGLIGTELFPVYWGKKYILKFAANWLENEDDCKIVQFTGYANNPGQGDNACLFYEQVEVTKGWHEYEIEFTSKYKSDNSATGTHSPTSGKVYMAISFPRIDNGPCVSGAPVSFAIDKIELIAKDNTMEFDYLEANNIKAYIDPIAPFLNNFQSSPKNQINYFEVPKNSGKSTIFTSNIWLGGIDDAGNVRVAAQRFCQDGFDYFLGPISNDYYVDSTTYKHYPNDAFVQKYHHTWKITKAEIDYHKLHYKDSGYEMPWAIANWPAHGRTAFGESWNLAPYKEMDGNGWYTPKGGDYPEIRGDEAVLFIMNDDLNKHTESGSINKLGVEIIGLAYAFNSPDETLQNTIFLSYYIRNLSPNNYKDFYFGFWTDFDIGYANDDYIGCDTVLNMMYGYNGKPIDGSGQTYAYGANPPAQGAMFLNRDMHAFIYHNNDGSPMGDPHSAHEYYNMLTGKWKGGQNIYKWGNGWLSNPTEFDTITTFMFDGNPLTGTGWNEVSTNNTPFDRRGLMSTGPFDLESGKSLTFDIALPFARKAGKSNLDALAKLQLSAVDVQDFFDKNLRPFPYIGVAETWRAASLQVFPNPTDGRFTILSEKVIESVELYDIMGRMQNAECRMQNGDKEMVIDVSRLPKGMYIYRAVLQGGSVAAGKIVVQ